MKFAIQDIFEELSFTRGKGGNNMEWQVRKISVLLTRYHSLFSDFIYFTSGRGYTHASISLGEDTCYYSFNLKGICVENLAERKPVSKDPKSICYEFEVSEFDYERMKRKIQVMLSNRQLFHYNRLGLIFCFLHIPFKRTQHYFCSQFVAELLSLTEDITLKKHPSLYLPNQFVKELEGQSSLCRVIQDMI